MKIKNLREYAVDIAVESGEWIEGVEPGAVVEVDDEHGKSLCEQADNWERVAEKTTRASKGA